MSVTERAREWALPLVRRHRESASGMYTPWIQQQAGWEYHIYPNDKSDEWLEGQYAEHVVLANAIGQRLTRTPTSIATMPESL